MTARGGKRPGAGRKPGAKNKATVARERRHQEAVATAIEKGLDPLEVMLDNMQFAHGKAKALLGKMLASEEQPTPKELKELLLLRQMSQECAKDAAPYIHPKLSSVEHSGSMSISHDDAVRQLEEEMRAEAGERPN